MDDWEDRSRGPCGIQYGVWIPRDPNYVKKKDKQKAPEQPKAPANDWIKIKVVDDQSGEVIPKVVLNLKTPDNSTEQHETRLSGMIESLGLQSGDCELSGDLSDLTIDNTLVFVGVGDSPSGQQSSSSSKPGKIPPPASGSRYRIAMVEEHKVKKGETLESLGKSIGMKWQELAKFNWGTDKPEEINKHLASDVGCTKKTADGKNYLFDDSDEPGILYLPKKWTQGGLATNQQHTIRVRFLEIPRVKFRIKLYDADGEPLANKPYSLELRDETIKDKTDQEGVLEASIPSNVEKGKLTLTETEEVYELNFGFLDPPDSTTGAQARLNNLGYNCGKVDGNAVPKTREALIAYRDDAGLDDNAKDDEIQKSLGDANPWNT